VGQAIRLPGDAGDLACGTVWPWGPVCSGLKPGGTAGLNPESLLTHPAAGW
jgi:hypothetical protein